MFTMFKATESKADEKQSITPVTPIVKAVLENNTDAVQLLFRQELIPDQVLNGEEFLIDTALSRSHSQMVVTLVEGGFTQSKQPKKVQEILLNALESIFVDRASIESALAQFETKHNLSRETFSHLKEIEIAPATSFAPS